MNNVALGAQHGATHPPGRILNISSMGGKVALPFLGAYSGSKHAVEGISHSLRRELKPLGIKVIIIGPGAVKSAIWAKPSVQTSDDYAQSLYAAPLAKFQKQFAGWSATGYTPEQFGQLIRQVFETKHPKTRYALVPNKLTTWSIPSRLPDRWLDWLLERLG